MFGKSAAFIKNYLITSNDFNADKYVSFLQRSLKKKADTILESIEGYQMTTEHLHIIIKQLYHEI